jgi:hypothetical protein
MHAYALNFVNLTYYGQKTTLPTTLTTGRGIHQIYVLPRASQIILKYTRKR